MNDGRGREEEEEEDGSRMRGGAKGCIAPKGGEEEEEEEEIPLDVPCMYKEGKTFRERRIGTEKHWAKATFARLAVPSPLSFCF